MSSLQLATVDTFRNGIHHMSADTLLRSLPANSVHCIVTSPPYYGLRNYNADGQIGLEDTPDQYVARMVALFELARRALRDDGVLWLNLGDSYQTTPKGNPGNGLNGSRFGDHEITYAKNSGLAPKQLLGIPWRVAFALQAAGWWLRSAIPWVKGNPMPESVQDRPTNAIEWVFILTKSEKYYYDPMAASNFFGMDAIRDFVVKYGYGNQTMHDLPQSFTSDGFLPSEGWSQSRIDVQGLREKTDTPMEGNPSRQGILTKNESEIQSERTREKETSGIQSIQCPENSAETVCSIGKRKSSTCPVSQNEQEKTGISPTCSNRDISGNSETLSANGQRARHFCTVCSQEAIRDEASDQYVNGSGMDRDTREIRSQVCLLREKVEIPDNGSCGSVIEGGKSHKGKRSASVSELQQQEGKQATRNHRNSDWFEFSLDALIGELTTYLNHIKTIKANGGLLLDLSGNPLALKVNTSPSPFQHFAMFPQALIEPMILSGCPAQVCAECGAGYERVVDVKRETRTNGGGAIKIVKANAVSETSVFRTNKLPMKTTLGFAPTCDCHADTARGIVVDPFMGSGTTALVAQRLQRDFIGCDVNADYVDLARDRVRYHGDDKRMVEEQAAGVEQLTLEIA